MGVNPISRFFNRRWSVVRVRNEHLSNLENILNRLKIAGFLLNKKKCSFFEKQVKYLWFIIDEDGLHKDDEKIKAILEKPIPEAITQVKAYCGLINNYGRFIRNVSMILNSIYDLINSKIFEWSKDWDKAFKKIKKKICSDTVLTHYRRDTPVPLMTDSSQSGVGACISHSKMVIQSQLLSHLGYWQKRRRIILW